MRFLKLAALTLICSTAAASAQTGSGPVYRWLQQQGYSQIHTYRDHARMRTRITAQRGNQTRRLVFDGRTGRLMWDSLNPRRDRTRDRLYLREFDRDRVRDRDLLKRRDRRRDPARHN